MSIKLVRSNQYEHKILQYNSYLFTEEDHPECLELTAWYQGKIQEQGSSYLNAYEHESIKASVFEGKFKYINIDNVHAIGPRCFLKLPSGDDDSYYLFGEEVLWGKRSASKEINRYETNSTNRVAAVDEAIILSAPGIHVYGHWLFDFIPRLIFAKSYMEQYPEKNITLIISEPSKWAEKFIKLFNFDNLMFLKGYEHAVINNAIVPLSLKNGCFVDTFALKITADFLSSNLDSIPDLICPRLFIMRRHTSIINQNEVASVLADYGFVSLYPEDLSIEQQVALFKNTQVVIGEDGSALHNLIFNETKGSTLVVFPREGRNNLWHTSVAKSVQSKLIIHDVINNEKGDCLVDIGSLKALIEHMILQ